MFQVTSAEQATNIAINFLKRYYYFARPVSAKRSNGTWEVLLDVGIVERKVARTEIDGATGEIVAYELPVPPEK